MRKTLSGLLFQRPKPLSTPSPIKHFQAARILKRGCFPDLGSSVPIFIDLLMGLLRGATFHHGGMPQNSPLALMGRFPSLMGRFPTLMGRFLPMPQWAVFPLWKSPGKQQKGHEAVLEICPCLSFLGLSRSLGICRFVRKIAQVVLFLFYRSGKTDPVQFKGFFQQGPFCL